MWRHKLAQTVRASHYLTGSPADHEYSYMMTQKWYNHKAETLFLLILKSPIKNNHHFKLFKRSSRSLPTSPDLREWRSNSGTILLLVEIPSGAPLQSMPWWPHFLFWFDLNFFCDPFRASRTTYFKLWHKTYTTCEGQSKEMSGCFPSAFLEEENTAPSLFTILQDGMCIVIPTKITFLSRFNNMSVNVWCSLEDCKLYMTGTFWNCNYVNYLTRKTS